MADRFSTGTGGTEAVDTRRYLAAIRRDLPLIGAIALGLTVFAVALSMVLPKTYSATATVGFDLNQATAGDAVAQERNIETQKLLVTQALVLTDAAQDLDKQGIKVDPETLRVATVAEPVFGANLLDITSIDEDAARSAAYANAIAQAYVDYKQGLQDSALKSRIAALERAIENADSDQTKDALQAQVDDLYAQLANQVDQVTFARSAVVPGAPESPKPLRNGVLALFVGLFLGVLIALLRDQLRPRFSSQRELSQFMEVPLIATIPELGRRGGVRATPQTMRIEQEAYQSLSAAIRLALPPGKPHVFMLTSSIHAEGKTTVATRLARLLAGSNHKTLLVSADLRWPRLDALLHVDGKPGFSDLLAAEANGGGASLEQIRSAIIPGNGRDRTSGAADVLASGNVTSDAARLLSSGGVEPLFTKLRQLGYAYIIVDTPPILGLADAKLIARGCDNVVVVGRLERISVNAALDLRDELGRVQVPTLGLVVIGGGSDASPYYSGVKFVTPAASDQPQGTPRVQVRE